MNRAGNFGYQTNRNVRTSSNGIRARHGHNYFHMIVYCIQINRDRKTFRKVPAEMFQSAREAFDSVRRKPARKL